MKTQLMKKILVGILAALALIVAGPTVQAQSCSPPPSGLVSWWPGDGNAIDIKDSNHGTLMGGTGFDPGVVGQAFSFDGYYNFVEVTDSPSLNIGTDDFSIDAWIRTTYDDVQTIMDKRVFSLAGVELGYHFFAGLAGLSFQMANGDSYMNYDSGAFVQDGNFHHVAVTVRRGSLEGGKIFVDGVVVLTFDPTPFAGNIYNTANFRIGGHSFAYPLASFHGLIDEIEFFKRALTDDEVRAIFNAGSAGKCKALSFLSIKQTHINFNKNDDKDSFNIRGRFVPSADGNGINVLEEAVTIEIGDFSATLPAGSFVQQGNQQKFVGSADGVKAQIWKRGSEYDFHVDAGRVDLGGKITNLTTIRLMVGDDRGEVNVRMKGELNLMEGPQ